MADDAVQAAGRTGGKAAEEVGQAAGKTVEDAGQAGRAGEWEVDGAAQSGANAASGAVKRTARERELTPLQIRGPLAHPSLPERSADNATDALTAATQSSVEEALTAAESEFRPIYVRDVNGSPQKIGQFEQLMSYRTYQGFLPKLIAGAKLKTIAIIPQSEQAIRRTFGYVTPIGMRQQDELRAYAKLFAEIENSIVISAGNSDTDSFLKSLRDGPPGPVIIVGHSEGDGASRLLMLPNGQGIAIERVHEECWRAARLCVVVTCESQDVRLGTVRLGEALMMAEVAERTLERIRGNVSNIPVGMRRALERGEVTEYDLMVYSMRTAVIYRRLATKTVFAAVGVGGAAGTAALYSQEYGGPT